MDVGVATFTGIHGAEYAFANARERDPEAGWLRDVAFVEVHRRGRIVVRGTVRGHYVDIDDEGDFMGDDTGIGAVAGAVLSFALGPQLLAVGLVAGATAGGIVQTSHIPELKGPAFDAIREQVPEGSSAVVVFSGPEQIEAMSGALQQAADTFVRYRFGPEAEAELEAALADAAAPPAEGRSAT